MKNIAIILILFTSLCINAQELNHKKIKEIVFKSLEKLFRFGLVQIMI